MSMPATDLITTRTTAPTTPFTDPAWFEALASAVLPPLPGVDRSSLNLKAEHSDFIRFNHAAVRQATDVVQGRARLSLVQGQKRMQAEITLSGDLALDTEALLAERQLLLDQLPEVPDDPFLLLSEQVVSSHRHEHGQLPTPAALVGSVAEAAHGLDFVGFYAGGSVVRAFADSRGQRNWHHVQSFHIDWCLYLAADKAIKSAYAGTHWDAAAFAHRVAEGAARLPLLAQPPHPLQPGAYRAWFTPAAMNELLGTLSWGGFGARDRQTGTSSLVRLAQGQRLDARMHLSENTAAGIAPAFTDDGFARPAVVPLVSAGAADQTLNSPRSVQEYGLPANGASAEEAPESLHLAAGDLDNGAVLATLGTGIFVSNLWYLNYSDRQACRMTGMTRFACFWVENGQLVAPLPVMRFDDAFLRLFGEGLVALGQEAELLPNSDTYGERQLSSVTTPGALVQGWRLTL